MKGSYILLIHLARSAPLTAGRLGALNFPSGYYLYFGSALGGLEARIGRHLRQDKKIRWHIDWLTAVATVVQVWWTEGGRRNECTWASAALELADVTLPARGFGSSDCRCPSHLVRVTTRKRAAALRRSLIPEPKGSLNRAYPIPLNGF